MIGLVNFLTMVQQSFTPLLECHNGQRYHLNVFPFVVSMATNDHVNVGVGFIATLQIKDPNNERGNMKSVHIIFGAPIDL